MFTILFLFACVNEKSNNSIALSIDIDTLQTTIGEPIILNIGISHPGSNIIDFPITDLSDNIQIKSSFFNVKKNLFDAKLELVFWDTGRTAIPEIDINIMDQDSSIISIISSDSIWVNVISVKEKNVILSSLSDDILPIKGPVEVKSYEDLKLIIKIILLIMIGCGIFLLWRKRIKEDSSSENTQNQQKPYEIALKKLKRLKKSDISSKKYKKVFFVDISFILREYIENSFFVRALEMTTKEIHQNSHMLPFNENQIIDLVSIFRNADLVKYAKYDIDDDQCLKDIDRSIAFVKQTSSKLLVLAD